MVSPYHLTYVPVVDESPVETGVAVIEVCESEACQGAVVDDILCLDEDRRLTGTSTLRVGFSPAFGT